MHEAIRTHGRPLAGSAGNATTLSSTMTSGIELVEDLEQARVDVLGAVDQRPPGGLDEPAQLLDRRRPEDRRGVPDEVLPELARDLGDLGRRTQPHQPLLEALGLERPRERLLDDEHDAVAALAQDVADPDAVVGRAEGALGEEHDRPDSIMAARMPSGRDPLAPIWSRIQAAIVGGDLRPFRLVEGLVTQVGVDLPGHARVRTEDLRRGRRDEWIGAAVVTKVGIRSRPRSATARFWAASTSSPSPVVVR